MLLDADILIDVALDRHPHSGPAAYLLDRIERERQRAFVAWHTVSNFYYLVSSAVGGADARELILDLLRFVSVAPADAEGVRYAASLPMRGFEDTIQVAAARACGAQHIVTRNVRDFVESPIPALTPREAIEALSL